MSRNLWRGFCAAVAFGMLVCLGSCGGATSAPISGASSLGQVSVVITPATMTVTTGSITPLNVTVVNSGLNTVQWLVNQIPGGDTAVGTIDSSGNFTAPQFVPKPPTVTVTAVANADNTKSGNAAITITGAQVPATVTMSPTSAYLQIGTKLNLAAAVTGPADTSVVWSVNGIEDGSTAVGTISPGQNSTAFYTAPSKLPSPAAVTIKAASSVEPNKTASCVVALSTQPPTIATITLSPLLAVVPGYTNFTFTAYVIGTSDQTILWEVNGLRGGTAATGTVTPGPDPRGTSTGIYTAPATPPPPPPLPALPTPMTVTAVSAAQPTRAATATLTALPASPLGVNISLTPTSAGVNLGGETDFTATVTNSTDESVTWQVNDVPNGNSTFGTIQPVAGSNNQVRYVTPNDLPVQNPVIVRAIPTAAPNFSATVPITLTVPAITVTVLPSSQQVVVGQTQQYTAEVKGPPDQTVTWQVTPNAGCSDVGTIASEGLYTAPATVPPSNCNPVVITAIANADGTTKGTATAIVVTQLSAVVTLSPLSANVQIDDSQVFTATVANAQDQNISEWQVNGVNGGNSTVGTVVANLDPYDSATYTAPATVPRPNPVTITAVSEQDPSSKGIASATITLPLPSVTVTPPGPVPVMPGQSTQFSAQVMNLGSNNVNWSLSGPPNGCNATLCGTITPLENGTDATYLAPQNIPPDPTINVIAASVGDPSVTGSSSVKITFNTALGISISPGSATVQASNTQPVTFQITISNAPSNTDVSWQLGCISLYNGEVGEGCGFLHVIGDKGGPGCTVINNGKPDCSSSGGNPGAGTDPLLYTAPTELFTNAFEENACESTNNGDGNGYVPLTATLSYNGQTALTYACIQVQP